MNSVLASSVSYSTDATNSFFAIMIIVWIAFLIGIVVICVPLYIIQAISLYQMAKTMEIDNPWLSWIPGALVYIMFIIPQKPFSMFGGKIHFKERYKACILYFCVVFGASMVLSISAIFIAIPVIGLIIYLFGFLVYFLAMIFMCFMIYYLNKDIYDLFSPSKNNTAIAIIGLFIPFVTLVYMFIIRNNKPVLVEETEENYMSKEPPIEPPTYY